MNGTDWGGRRPGTGPKPRRPKASAFAPQVHQGGHGEAISALPPEDLPAGQRAFWQTYGPLAVEKRTLTSHTVGAFRQLCEMDEERRGRKGEIDRDGRTYIKAWTDSSGQEHQELKAHPLLAKHDSLWKDIMAGLARFGLAPFGKAEQPTIRPKAANPWAGVAHQ